jgi:hypothetical protein
LKRSTTFVITRFSNSEVTVYQIIVDLALFSEVEQHNIASNVHLKINPDVKQMEGSIGSIPSRKHEEHLSPSYASPLPRPPPKPKPKKSALSQISEGRKRKQIWERGVVTSYGCT